VPMNPTVPSIFMPASFRKGAFYVARGPEVPRAHH
jgi:hypothetical protein